MIVWLSSNMSSPVVVSFEGGWSFFSSGHSRERHSLFLLNISASKYQHHEYGSNYYSSFEILKMSCELILITLLTSQIIYFNSKRDNRSNSLTIWFTRD